MKCNELLNHLPALKGQGRKTHEDFPPLFSTNLDLFWKTLSRSLKLQNEKMHLFLGIFPLFFISVHLVPWFILKNNCMERRYILKTFLHLFLKKNKQSDSLTGVNDESQTLQCRWDGGVRLWSKIDTAETDSVVSLTPWRFFLWHRKEKTCFMSWPYRFF